MIRNQWYVVLKSTEVGKKPVGVTRMGEKLVFWRGQGGEVQSMRDQCPHLGAPLHLGKVVDGALRCPFHGFEFDPGGQCRHIPALGRSGDIPRAMRAGGYFTHETEGFIWIYWGEAAEKPPAPAYFDNLGSQFSYMDFVQHWPVHYSRVVENQLDVMHLPFIHATTIGRGGRAVVEGPLVRYKDGQLDLWVYNRLDDGTPPRKMEDLPEPDRHPFLVFLFPNLWMNWISDNIRVIVAFVPVDDENMLFYGRFTQNMTRLPLVRDLFNAMGVIGSIQIANQDRRVVSLQRPKRTSLKKMGEKLTQGDRGILTYRTIRHALMVASGQIEKD